MCFYIDKDFPNELTANKNIICYKVVNKDYFSRYYLFYAGKIKYDEFTEYTAKINSKTDANELIVSYSEIDVGIHSYSTLWKCFTRRFSGEVMIKCIIPKGTPYYYNEKRKEYVSLKIKRIRFWRFF